MPTHHLLPRALALALGLFLTLSLTLALALAPSATAAPTDLPTSVDLPDDSLGAVFIPGIRLVEDLAQEIVEEEFFVSGNAALYNYEHNPPEGHADIEAIQEDIPYRTRILVRRPAHHGHFNGTVVIEWWNTTAGFETAPVWDVSAEHFARTGTIYVGITNANQGISFLLGGCSVFDVLPPTCGTRYASLSLPDDGLAYEMASQITALLKSDSPLNPLPPNFAVERVYHSGQSQQGGSMVTYASAFHETSVNDGYFIQANVFPRSINGEPSCGAPGSSPFPSCTPLLEGDDRWVRTDLSAPVVQALGETDLAALFGIVGRQADTPTFRYYELAGVAHLTVHKDVVIFGPFTLESLCENELNTSADGPVVASYLYNAMWDNLEQQVQRGRVPPAGRLIETDGAGAIVRDEFMNALGGVRVPEMDVPTASYYPPTNQADPGLPGFLQFIGNLACRFGGSVMPFDDATLDELYPTHGAYVNQVMRAANHLQQDGFLLPKDRQIIGFLASHSTIGCGLGFELALVLPPLMWLRARRRRH